MNYRFKVKPYKHQTRALKKLLINRGGALFMPMRSGKTKVAVDFCGAMHLKFGVVRVLIVCPLSVKGVWRREIRKNLPDELRGRIRFVILNYEQVYKRESYRTQDDDLAFQMLDNAALWKFAPELIIVDESHKIGSDKALISKKLYKLQKHQGVKYKVILTGTPVHRRLAKAFGMFKFLDDSLFGTDFGVYEDTYCLMGGYDKKTLLKYINLKQWRKKIEPITFNMAHVPMRPPVHAVVPVELDTSWLSYRQMADEFLLEVGGEVIESPLVVTRLMRLAQICGGHIKGEDGTHIVGREKQQAWDELLEQMDGSGIAKVVVFCRFVQELKDVAKVAKRRGYRVLALHGGTPGHIRERRIAAFAELEEKVVFVSQIAAGALGIDLSAADTAVFYSLSESAIDFDQACARIRRFRDDRVLTYYYLLATGSVDEVIYLSVQQKIDLADMVMKHPDILHHLETG